jgi:hypothetical protein
MYGGQNCEITKKVEIELVEQKEYEVVFFDSRTPAWLTFTIQLVRHMRRSCTAQFLTVKYLKFSGQIQISIISSKMIFITCNILV